jgi:OOP family OmpA-OmpF porin
MKLKKMSIILSLVLTLAACSSRPEIKQFPKSADAKQEITNLKLAIEDFRKRDYNLLAPESFKSAKSSLKNAQALEKDGKKNEKVLKEVALGNAYLERLEKNAEDNKAKLQDILAARQSAINAQAVVFFSEKLSKLDNELKEQAAYLEKDKDSKLKEKRSDFIAGYSDLELAAIKRFHLGESKSIIDDSIKNGARDLAPKTLSSTNKKYKEVDSFITQNRHDTARIDLLSVIVLEEAINLARTTATARGLSAATTEENALRVRAEQERLNTTRNELIEEKGATQALSAMNSELSEEQKLNAIYEKARRKFSEKEAEVYKQGSNLVIRLKAIEFPKSQAVLQGDNFALLKKVEDVIESFDKSAVTVEGHTDSTGSEKVNRELSEKRADAVVKYLEVNTQGNVSEFESKGYGFDKPLASNKTPEGRAQNRRVDVIIEPVRL